MIKIKVTLFIVLLQAVIPFFASEDKDNKIILSEEDDRWLGKIREEIFKSKYPQTIIAAHLPYAVKYQEFLLEPDTSIRNNIKHAENWLHYFSQKKELGNQLGYCLSLQDSALCFKAISGINPSLAEEVFLKLLSYGIDNENFKISGENSFLIKFCKALSSELFFINSWLYFYQPSLSCFAIENNKKVLWLESLVDGRNTIHEYDNNYEKMLIPTMYQLAEKGLVKYSYKDVQDLIKNRNAAKAFLFVLKRFEKEQKIKIPKMVYNSCIFQKHLFSTSVNEISIDYKQASEFIAYCDHVEQEICSQIEEIKKNDSPYYQERLSKRPFFVSPEAFKEWYQNLKMAVENK